MVKTRTAFGQGAEPALGCFPSARPRTRLRRYTIRSVHHRIYFHQPARPIPNMHGHGPGTAGGRSTSRHSGNTRAPGSTSTANIRARVGGRSLHRCSRTTFVQWHETPALPRHKPQRAEVSRQCGGGTYFDDVFLEASDIITSEATVSIGRKVSYRAGNDVHLTPGFHAEQGAKFHAFIHPCDVPGNSFQPKAAIFVQSDLNKERDDEDETMLVFPDPAHDVLTLDPGENDSAPSLTTIRIYDTTGQLVLERQLQNGLEQVDVSALRPGLYTVRWENGSVVKIGRVVIN